VTAFSQSGQPPRLRRILGHVVRHELRLLARGRTAPIVFLLMIVPIVYAAWNGTRWADEQRATIAQIQRHDDSAYASIAAQLGDLARRGDPRPNLQLAGMAWYMFQPEGAAAPAPHIDPRRAEAAASEWVGARHAVLPPSPLSALAVGQGDLHPYYTRVSIRTRPVLVHSDELENPINLLSGRFDLAFVLTFCCPILVLPLVYNVLSEERESGTLALVASQPLSLWVVMFIRIAVRGGAVLAAILCASLIALTVFGGLDLGAAPGAVASAATALDLAVWCGAVTATVLFWCGLAAIVNVTPWRSATNATALTVAWLVLVVVLPALLGEIASTLAPVPSRVQLISAVRAAGNLKPTEVAALVSTYYEEHPGSASSALAADVTAIRGLAQQDEIDRRIGPILSAYRAATARQESLADRLRYLSPPLLVYDAITELAGTTTARYRRFSEQVDAYHADWRRYFYPLVHARTSLTPRHYENAPRFTFQDEDRRAVRTRALRLVSVTSVIGVLLLAGALWRVRRFHVRT
jgi:ABC-2 type transport system permease protein